MVFFCISWLAKKRRQGRRFVGGERAALIEILLLGGALCVAQEPAGPPPAEQTAERFHRIISNQRRNEETLDLFERVQKVEIRKTASDATPSETKVWRLFPTGAGMDKIPLPSEANSSGSEATKTALEKLEKYLSWISEDGAAQKEAYAKFERKRREKFELIQATHDAFIFTLEGHEIAPGVWEPTFEQYDFDGRKYLIPFSIHERTFYSNYKRVGPPREVLEAVRAELGKTG